MPERRLQVQMILYYCFIYFFYSPLKMIAPAGMKPERSLRWFSERDWSIICPTTTIQPDKARRRAKNYDTRQRTATQHRRQNRLRDRDLWRFPCLDDGGSLLAVFLHGRHGTDARPSRPGLFHCLNVGRRHRPGHGLAHRQDPDALGQIHGLICCLPPFHSPPVS